VIGTASALLSPPFLAAGILVVYAPIAMAHIYSPQPHVDPLRNYFLVIEPALNRLFARFHTATHRRIQLPDVRKVALIRALDEPFERLFSAIGLK
jgi:hypothetical protein